MKTTIFPRAWVLTLLLMPACQAGDSGSIKSPDGHQEPASKATAGYATGKITMEDGTPLRGDIKDLSIAISGVSEAGEKVNYAPIIKNGVYRQKLVPGQYRFGTATITLKFNSIEHTMKLVPVGENSAKNQDSTDGILQDFQWKPTGQAETYGATPNPNNHTHWHGLSVGMAFATYREDLKKGTNRPPVGTKLIFTLSPTSKTIDGKELKPFQIEREWKANGTNDALNDLPIATYTIAGIAKYSDGKTKPILFMGPGDYPKFHAQGTIKIEKDGIIGGLGNPLYSWVVDE